MAHYYSPFWLAFAAGAPLGAAWRDESLSEELIELEAMPMREWLKLPHTEHGRVVGEYTGSKGPLQLPRTSGAVRRARLMRKVATYGN